MLLCRDASRVSEEDLFEKLNERTNDLERLQESYVDIGDRCNDLQDEVAELREQTVALQAALAARSLFAASAGGSPASNGSGQQPQGAKVVKDSKGDGKATSRTNPNLHSTSHVKSPPGSSKPSTRQTVEDFEEYEDEFEDDN